MKNSIQLLYIVSKIPAEVMAQLTLLERKIRTAFFNVVVTLFCLITFFESQAFSLIFSLAYLRHLSKKSQILLFFFIRFLLVLLLFKGGIQLGFLLMNELAEAILPYLNPFPEMPGEGGAAPGPLGNGGTPLLHSPHEENERHELVGVVREPLIADSVRREELESYFRGGDTEGVDPKFHPKLVDLQFQLEVRLEYALREDGFTENSIMETRREWRREALMSTSREEFVSISNLRKNLAIAEIRNSAAYRKIMRACSYNHPHGHIHLRKAG